LTNNFICLPVSELSMESVTAIMVTLFI